MKLYSIQNIPYTTALGLVSGNIVKGRFFVKDYIASIRKILGREMVEYTELMEDVRGKAINRMIAKAEALGADAIIGVTYMTSEIASETADIYVYGTAVKL